MIYLRLFLTFFKIGAVSFGGGMGMISLIREECLSHGWLTEEEILNFIAVSESTPGPIAVNIATFIGSSQGGIAGALLATFGVILPSFIVILLIAALLGNILKFAGVQATLAGIRPAVVGLIIATALTMLLKTAFGIGTVNDGFALDAKCLGIIAFLAAFDILLRTIRKKSISPIFLILLSGGLGILLYGL